jgi:two-component system sensor histidine kinase KdpD
LSLFFSLGPVLFAATLSAVVWNFFFIPPIFTFVISSSEDIILCLSYFVVAITTGCLTHRLKRHEIIFKEREERTQILFQVTKDIAESSTKEKYLPKVSEQLDRILDGHSGFLIRSSNTQHLDASPIYSSTRLNLGEKDWAVAAWALENKKSAGWSTESLPLSKYIYIPLRSKQEVIGLFIFRSNKEKKLSLDKANLIASVLNQVSLSLERHLFEERSLAADRLHESEALHQALLNSVSHELKTPLTTIMSSARALNDPQLQEDAALRNEVSEDLLIASQRLNRVIDNLLDMTRLNSGILTLKKDWYDVLELIRLTIQNLQQDLHGRKIEVIGEDVPLVRVDYRLLEQVFSNLILNAHLYSPPNEPISILVEVAGAKLKILVRDRGIGIPETELENIFEKFYRLRKVNKEGSGLGLFIAKSFVDAHGGTLRARRLEKGTEFEILLPIEKTPPIFAIDDDDASENA